MPVISLWQPWAQWIVRDWKQIETRTHSRFASLLNQTIAIHASAKWDNTALELARLYLTKEQIKITEQMDVLESSIIGTAYVYKFEQLHAIHSRFALIDCDSTLGRWGLFLDHIRSIKPIPVKGKQGIWYYEFK